MTKDEITAIIVIGFFLMCVGVAFAARR